MRTVFLVSVTWVALAIPVAAQEYHEFPAPLPGARVPHSKLTGEAVFIPPYRRPFPIRVYTTPPRQPYYNVPPYAVIAPY